ncbi:MAG TPA: ferritin-like domain-containing protein, partial [Planctomycetota bacterium]|nr:ferritin-like domain-containing protein [Planctomycetota bacterium]
LIMDFFPVEQVTDASLRGEMLQHRKDERKHAGLFLRSIKRIGGRDLDLSYGYTLNNAVLQKGLPYGPRPLAADGEGAIQLAHFLAHMYVVERRGLGSFRFQADACRQYGLRDIADDIEVVIADEEKHVKYTSEAVINLLGRIKGEQFLKWSVDLESYAHRAYARWLLEELLRQRPDHPSRAWRAFYRLCIKFLEFHDKLLPDRPRGANPILGLRCATPPGSN